MKNKTHCIIMAYCAYDHRVQSKNISKNALKPSFIKKILHVEIIAIFFR